MAADPTLGLAFTGAWGNAMGRLHQAFYGYGVGVYSFLTRRLVVDGDPSALSIAWGWLIHNRPPAAARSVLGRPNATPIRLLLEELQGCLVGPWVRRSARTLDALQSR